MSRLSAQMAPLQARWRSLARREQTLLMAAGAVVGVAVLWWLLMAPALQTLRTAPARHAELDTQLQHMQALQAEAQQLQAVPRARSGDAVRTLQASVAQRLGAAAQMSTTSDRATVTLKGAPAERVADWLSQVRSAAHAVPVEVRLVRSTAAASAAKPTTPGGATPPAATQPASDGLPRWDGTVVLALPPN